MKISENIYLVQPPGARKRLIFGWCMVIALSAIEFLALNYGKPSNLKQWSLVEEIIAWTANEIPVVRSFGRCAARVDAGTGLMLTLNVIFFLPKLAALYCAYPKKLSNPDRGLRAMWGNFYMFMIGLVCLVPALIFFIGWGNSSGESGLTTLRLKMSALCQGGVSAFAVGAVQSGFALAGTYVSVVIFSSLLRNLVRSATR